MGSVRTYLAPVNPRGLKSKPTTVQAAPVLLPLVVLAALVPWLAKIDSLLHAVLAALFVLVCGFGIMRSVINGVRPVVLIFSTFYFAWLGIGSIYQLAHGEMPWGDYALLTQDGLLTHALLLNFLSVSSFIVGSEIYLHRDRTRKELIGASAPSVVIPRGFTTWVLIGGAIVLLPGAASASGGFSVMFSSRGDRADALIDAGISVTQAGGVQAALVRILPSALAIAAAYLAVLRARTASKRSGFMGLYTNEFLAVVLSMALLFIYCNPMANTRFISVLAFGAVAFALLQPRSKGAAKIIAGLAMFGTAIIYPLANVFRAGSNSTSVFKTGTEAFAGMDFDGFQQVANAVVLTRDVGHSFGQYTLSAIGYAIPRSMWEGKATPASIDVAENRGYAFTNLSLPFHGEMYLEFGLIGMCLVMLLLGLLCSKADSEWLAGAHTKLGILAPVMAMAMLGFLRGPLGSLAPVYLTALGLVFIGLKSTKTKPRTDKLAKPLNQR